MAGSAVQTNNVAVKYRGKAEREMPSESQAQNAAMHAAAEGRSTLGIPKKVGEDFVKADKGRKIGKLPRHVKRAHARGHISDAALKKHFGE